MLTDFLDDAESESITSYGYDACAFIYYELESAQFDDTVCPASRSTKSI